MLCHGPPHAHQAAARLIHSRQETPLPGVSKRQTGLPETVAGGDASHRQGARHVRSRSTCKAVARRMGVPPWARRRDPMMALIEIPQSCSSEFLRSRGQVSAGSCRS
ncbi:hypothetical protein ACFPRL_32220 [Pseudoclavibacter helvolus]